MRLSMLKAVGDNSNPHSLANTMRRKRFAFFLSLLNAIPRPVQILDVGGEQQFWRMMGLETLRGVQVTLLNLRRETVTEGGHFESVVGDARDLSRYESQSFDVVFSNSVIEHLGPDFDDQRRMANEVRRVGKRYFVQTPNRYFPIEPHFLTPGFQFLPLRVRTWLVSHFSIGWYPRIREEAAARREVESIVLLTRRQLCDLFPEALIYEERIAGLTKSFVAYHGWTTRATRG